MEYFNNDFSLAQLFANLFCLPHYHHHEKKMQKSLSGTSLSKMNSSHPHKNLGSLSIKLLSIINLFQKNMIQQLKVKAIQITNSIHIRLFTVRINLVQSHIIISLMISFWMTVLQVATLKYFYFNHNWAKKRQIKID